MGLGGLDCFSALGYAVLAMTAGYFLWIASLLALLAMTVGYLLWIASSSQRRWAIFSGFASPLALLAMTAGYLLWIASPLALLAMTAGYLLWIASSLALLAMTAGYLLWIASLLALLAMTAGYLLWIASSLALLAMTAGLAAAAGRSASAYISMNIDLPLQTECPKRHSQAADKLRLPAVFMCITQLYYCLSQGIGLPRAGQSIKRHVSMWSPL